MSFDALGTAELYLTKVTNLKPEQFEVKFHEQNIIDAKLQLTLSDGSVQLIDVMEILNLKWTLEQKENH